MGRGRWLLLIAAAVTFSALLVWLRVPDLEARVRLALQGPQYDSAASWVLASSSAPEPGKIVEVSLPSQWGGLSSRGIAWRFRSGGRDFVYFVLDDDVTVTDGLVFTSSGSEPPDPPVDKWNALRDRWWSGWMNGGYMETGGFEQPAPG